jgi:Domain of unknown function (DUF5060)/Protein of unknown function (DUF4038)
MCSYCKKSYLWCLFLSLSFALPVAGADMAEKPGLMWAPFLEWSLSNPSYKGNPFDVIAKATFEHRPSGEKRVTEMFYDGGKTWKFRFTGTKTGKWFFSTSSQDTNLNGHKGTVVVKQNSDQKIRGFLTHKGNKYAIQTGNNARLEGYLFNVYMQQTQFDPRGFADWDEAKIKSYCATAKKNGFEIIFIHVNNQWFKLGEQTWTKHKNRDPDRKTFAVLEKIITTAHRQGCRVHLWAWGDERRKWTPIGAGGINGKADRRVQRYIASRLGPLPGWTMGYGFDLHEWVKPDQLNEWAKYLHKHLGWQHLLCARGYPLTGPDNILSYEGFGRREASLATSSHGPRDYQEIVDDINSNKTHPHLYEERHSYLRKGFTLDMDGTRRLLWWESMAGGMGGFFGFYYQNWQIYPYPHPEQLRTHYTFWHTYKRFRLNMQRADKLRPDLCPNGYVLEDTSNKHYVFYQESTNSIQVDLAGMNGPQSAVAVDTKKEYRQINLGELKPEKQTIKLPSTSDWALAVGDFQRKQ